MDTGTTAADLWNVWQGRASCLSEEAIEGFVDGQPSALSSPLFPTPGQCASFWLDQDKLATLNTQVDFGAAIEAFAWLDGWMLIFFLPCYDLPCEFPFFPDSMQWTQTWWDPSLGGTKICIYFDGSFVAGQSNAQSGAGIAAFVFTNDRWAFAEALSTGLDAGFRSYQAEAAAGVVALKFFPPSSNFSLLRPGVRCMGGYKDCLKQGSLDTQNRYRVSVAIRATSSCWIKTSWAAPSL